MPDSAIKRPTDIEEINLNVIESLGGPQFVSLEVVVGHFLLGSAGHHVFDEDHQFRQPRNVTTVFGDESVEYITMGYALWQSCHSVEVLQVPI